MRAGGTLMNLMISSDVFSAVFLFMVSLSSFQGIVSDPIIAVQPASKFFRAYAGVFGNVSIPVCVSFSRVFLPSGNNSNVTRESPGSPVSPGVSDLLLRDYFRDFAEMVINVAFVLDHEFELKAGLRLKLL